MEAILLYLQFNAFEHLKGKKDLFELLFLKWGGFFFSVNVILPGPLKSSKGKVDFKT